VGSKERLIRKGRSTQTILIGHQYQFIVKLANNTTQPIENLRIENDLLIGLDLKIIRLQYHCTITVYKKYFFHVRVLSNKIVPHYTCQLFSPVYPGYPSGQYYSADA
jgi:hypothetical protein